MKNIIGIMAAMPEEIDSIHALMKNSQEKIHGGRKYYLGQIGTHDVVLVFSRWGKVAAAATVTSLITEFKITQLIFTGVAGAVASDLRIGDIIISDQLYQHDMDARPLFKKHQIPLTDIVFFQADIQLKKHALKATQDFLQHISQSISNEALAKFFISRPQSRLGKIATGDQFIYSIEQTQKILSDMPDVDAVEMEGAAVAQVCHDYDIPFVIIRTISDKADHSAEMDFPAFIAEIARHYSERIIAKMLL